MSRISWENYEEYMMMHADGELQEPEARELMAFVAQHPQLQSELEEYSAVRLVPDTTIVYANKQSLMKEEPVAAPRIMAFPVWKKYSIAAAVAAVLFLGVYKMTNSSNEVNNNAVAVNSNKQDLQVKKENVTEPVNNTPAQVEAPVNNAVAHHKQTTPTTNERTMPVLRQQVVKQEQVAHQDTKQVTPVNEAAPALQLREGVAPVEQLPVAVAKAMQPQPSDVVPVTTIEVPAYAAVQAQPEEKTTFLDKLPVDDIKKKQIGNIASAIKDATESKKWSVKIEKKKLVLSF